LTTTSTQATRAPDTGEELVTKLALVREAMERADLGAIRLRGRDWFSWATCGGSNAVLLSSDVGVAEILVTQFDVWVVTDVIEAERLRAEELPRELPVQEFAWERPADREAFVTDAAGGRPIAADMPASGELGLPDGLAAAKLRLQPSEVERYRSVARDAAEAMTETVTGAAPELTERELAGQGAAAMWRRGIEPALVLVGGSQRADQFRHPTATDQPLEDHAVVVFCGRRAGLFANLTRHVYFRQPTPAERSLDEAVAHVEAAAWTASRPGATLGEVYEEIAAAYAQLGHAGAERLHHQGGITGYRAREALAMPGSSTTIEPTVALAWNPSLPGAKIEDTILRHPDEIEILSIDPAWPVREIDGRSRPDLLVIG
jgi:Xaa-Pro aminopeptidase